MVEELRQHGHRVSVLTPARGRAKGNSGPGNGVMRFPWLGDGRPIVAYSPFRVGDLRAILSLLREGTRSLCDLVQDEAIDHCLALWAVPSGYWARGAMRALGVPYSVWCLGSDLNQWGHRPVTGRIIRTILRDATCCFADGIELARKAETISGRSCDFLPTVRPLSLATAAPVALDREAVNLLFIGRWERVKGIDVLVEAMRAVRARAPGVRLHVVGGGSLEGELRTQIAADGLQEAVLLHGSLPTEELTGYMVACDAVVIPSRSESIPLVFGEAVQAGKPLIVTDVGDMGDLIRKYGGGVVVPPQSPQQLAEAIVSFAQDHQRGAPGAADRAELRELFSVSRVVDQFLSAIGQIPAEDSTTKREVSQV
ncbi:MAG: hypothetical protein COS65_33855 [Armatimonadetes bacterium CG06_land_8_20_14_3_00_66_21]|nr:MAG: hypothetical protein COS65_33855 [Armatimonadetes bacterium CG06_land_8_20_14_3_00_66_21]